VLSGPEYVLVQLLAIYSTTKTADSTEPVNSHRGCTQGCGTSYTCWNKSLI
jgi:hypothetical protein